MQPRYRTVRPTQNGRGFPSGRHLCLFCASATNGIVTFNVTHLFRRRSHLIIRLHFTITTCVTGIVSGLSSYSSWAVYVIVGGQSTTDCQHDFGGQLVDIVVRQQVELTKAVNEMEKLKEKVGHLEQNVIQLEAQLSINRQDNRKSHVYAFVFSARRYCKGRKLSVRLSVTLWHCGTQLCQ